jgi:Collagen triple helix repeat (20 copies)
MFSSIRMRMTYANIVATLALVFAMSGGALAAGHYLITSTKQIKPSVLASLKGKSGAAGAPGATGPAGSGGPAGKEGPQGKEGVPGEPGKEGAPGAPGTNGKNGKGVVASEEAKSAGSHCAEGGVNVEVENSGKKEYACNGKEGPQGKEGNIAKTLAPGETETGVWSYNFAAPFEGFQSVAISFAIPLGKTLEFSKCGAGEGTIEGQLCRVFYRPTTFPTPPECSGLTGSEKTECEEIRGHDEARQKASEANCTGSADEPKAAEGSLCIYVGKKMEAFGETFLYEEPGAVTDSTGTSGLLWRVYVTQSGQSGYGSWAVTEKSS